MSFQEKSGTSHGYDDSTASITAQPELNPTKDKVSNPSHTATSHLPRPPSTDSTPVTAQSLAAHTSNIFKLNKNTIEAKKLRQAAQSLGIDTSLPVFENIVKETEYKNVLPMERYVGNK